MKSPDQDLLAYYPMPNDYIKIEHEYKKVEIKGNRLKTFPLLAMKDLTDREQEVITLRFGLDGNQPHTLEEVGQMFHVTRERIRQIEAKALRKLGAPSRKRMLRDFL